MTVCCSRPSLAVTQRERELVKQAASSQKPSLPVEASAPVAVGERVHGAERPARFAGDRTLDPHSHAGDFEKISEEVVRHLAAVPGLRLTVRVEIEAEVPDGFAEDIIRTVRENAATLRFDGFRFTGTDGGLA